MNDLPAPLTPTDCDLRGYDFMPLLGNRLFQSSLYRLAVVKNPRAGLAAIKLWWEAWNQVPCGSLPDDECELAMMADFGADVDAWRACADLTMRGFVKCSDGRWYHPIVCEQAVPAFEKRTKHEEKLKKDKERQSQWRDKNFGKRSSSAGRNTFDNAHVTRDVTCDTTRDETPKSEEIDVTSRRMREREYDTLLPSVVEAAAQSALPPGNELTDQEPAGSNSPSSLPGDIGEGALFPLADATDAAIPTDDSGQAPTGPSAAILTPTDILFRDGLSIVCRRATLTPGKARALIGRWRGMIGNDDTALNSILFDAENQSVAHLQSWVPKAIEVRRRGRPSSAQPRPHATDWMVRELQGRGGIPK